ncbi:MAG: DUF1569 domain-containing protein [Flavobacteriales bacterium]|jgi:hypothetical protein|nr:DUF1569 domain-containing protein [Flavobacteriales bacterium]
MLLNTFEAATTEKVLTRLATISHETLPLWGKMNAAQMLAHLNVAYDMAYHQEAHKTSWLQKILLKTFVKKIVVGDKPYAKNSRTAPAFLITSEKEFENEKSRFIENLKTTEQKGVAYFEGRESASFGPLSAKEWSNMFYKHIDHHFAQFGA